MIPERTIGSVCTEIVDCEHRTAPEDVAGKYWSIGTPAMKGNRIDYSLARRISEATFVDWTRRLVPRRGDLILSREAPVGLVVEVPHAGLVALGQRTMLLRPNPDVVDPRYLFFLLQGEEMQHRLLQRAAGSTVPHLNVGEVRDLVLPDLPPIGEQRAIADVLGALDNKIESNRRLSEVADELVRAEVTAACAHGDLGLVSDLVISQRSTVKPADVDPSTRYVGLEHMPRGRVILDTWGSAEGLGSTKAKFESGDILFGKLRPYFKKVGLGFSTGGVCSTDILVLRPVHPNLRAVALTVLASDEFIDFASSAASGTRMPRASWDHMKTFATRIPSLHSLHELAQMVDPILETAQRAVEQSVTLAALRDALLPELLSGRLRVPVAEELVESAS